MEGVPLGMLLEVEGPELRLELIWIATLRTYATTLACHSAPVSVAYPMQ